MIASTPSQRPVEELERVGRLLIDHWTLALPSAIASLVLVFAVFAGLISTVAGALLGHAAAGHTGTGIGLASGLMAAGALFLAGVIGLFAAQAMVIAAAPGVLSGAAPDLGLAFRVTIARLPNLIVAAVACFVLALVPMVLCLVLVGIPLVLVLGYLLMYVPAAVVIDGEGGLRAIATSYRLATTRVNDTIVCWLGAVAVSAAGIIANSVLVHVPLVNLISGFAVGGLTSAYAALLTASFYLRLRSGGTFAPPPTTFSP